MIPDKGLHKALFKLHWSCLDSKYPSNNPKGQSMNFYYHTWDHILLNPERFVFSQLHVTTKPQTVLALLLLLTLMLDTTAQPSRIVLSSELATNHMSYLI